ncbi:restriction endonuclease subunit S [Vibrio parahaemolyticus]|uniref:restriction endonuclease subunit S n=1 Tax=Vibrio parahaemolyticus TaxID=670 RepID=UPI00193640B4|nr:restriction endonuclease subunit S [Vibrio parahaemolyticus]EHK4783245.1 restriction endonuclease subunit S [Vibrio parahaemolyticus]EIJ0973763.1 restriction endonuclease subunit S [Vibrio parahaemolyticus]EJO4005664.1 restriction endonuclease subunit S [Vibrio parahaemolyticus]MBM4987793.1 restriction endonuclease subunit S [Vibrio parahaemolyticus]MBM4992227.1 restriction endonuclease subunit S [Vibrio parahaemolyticus]
MEQVLYKLPDGWEWHSVKKLSHKIQYGHTAKAESNGNAKFLRITDIQDGKIDWQEVPTVSLEEKEISKYALNDDDLIFARSGATAGKSILIKNAPKDAVFASYLIRIVPNKNDIIPEYLSYFFLTPAYWEVVGQNAAGAAQPNINGTKLSEFIVPVAPQGEQKRIVEKLDVLLTRIDIAIDHLQESVTLADALYASTINEQMMQAIELAGLSTVEKHIEQIQTGTTPPTKQPEFYENGDINWFAPSDFGDHDILSDSNKKLSQKAFDAGKARKFGAGTIMLVAIGATIGKIGYLEQDASSNQQITGMKFNSDIIPRYAYYWFRFIKPEILTSASTATLPIINQKGIKALSFCAPNKQLQETICKKIDEVSNFRNTVKAELNEKVELMRSLKASILDSAFKGEL